jgi:hypothetical protein
MRHSLSTALAEASVFDCIIVDGGVLGTTPSDYGLYAMVDEVILLETAQRSDDDGIQVVADLLQHRRIKAKAVFIEAAPTAAAA